MGAKEKGKNGSPLTALDEVPMETVSLSAQLTELVRYKEEQLKKLQHQSTLETANLMQIRQQQTQARQDLATELATKRQDAEREWQAQQRAFAEEQRVLEFQRRELAGMRREAEAVIAQAEDAREVLRHLRDERVAIEQQRVRNDELRIQNEQLIDRINTQQAEAHRARQLVEQEETRVRAMAAALDERARQLQATEERVRLESENLSTLKDHLDPKLKEIQQQADRASAELAQAKVLHEEIATRATTLDQQQTALVTLSTNLEAKGRALTEFDVALRRTAQELQIKIQQAATKGIKVKMPTAPERLE